MNTTSTKQINAQACEWFTLMQSGSVSEAERQALQEWLTASEAHWQAYREYEAVWADLGALAQSSEGAALRRSIADQNTSSFWSRLGFGSSSGRGEGLAQLLRPQVALAFAIFGAALVFWFSSLVQEAPVRRVQYQTQIGEIRTITLADGSDVTLGAKSQIEVVFSESLRYVALHHGQAFFDVAKDPARPFEVNVDHTLVRVVGTQFDVYKGAQQVRVAVAEGVVRVFADPTAQAPEQLVELTAGEQVTRLPDGHVQVVQDLPVNGIAAWRQGRLAYQRASLAEVINDANRYYPGTIHLDPSLAQLEVTAAFNAAQLDSLPETLETFLPIEVTRKSGKQITITPTDKASLGAPQ